MKLFRKTDILVIAAIIAAAAVIWMLYSNAVSGRPVKAEIYYYSDLVDTVELVPGQEKTIPVQHNENVVLQLDGDGASGSSDPIARTRSASGRAGYTWRGRVPRACRTA